MTSGARTAIAAVTLLAVLASVVWVATQVDFEPEVESDFFFASDDPQLAASRRIDEIFPSSPQLLVVAQADDVTTGEGLESVRALTDALTALDGVSSVNSLTSGPATPTVANSPLWGRFLGRGTDATQLVIGLENGERELVERLDAVLDQHRQPGFDLAVSGVPWVVERIRRALGRDLRTFSLAALLLFGLLIAVVYRRPRRVAGALICCAGASAATLAILDLSGATIGLLTANLVPIATVLTLSHVVFLLANVDQAIEELGDAEAAVALGVRRTIVASGWCMATTFAGFLSLRFASAQPLRELGSAGAVATLAALAVAYGVMPAFLDPRAKRRSAVEAAPGAGRDATDQHPRRLAFDGPTRRWAVALVTLAAVCAIGLPRLDTDPTLLQYFAPGSEVRDGLTVVDQAGGSSPLTFLVRDPDGGTFVDDAVLAKFKAAQEAVERDPRVGTALSLPVLVDEARLSPFAAFLQTPQLIDLLDSPQYGSVASSFVDADRQRALLFLRLREEGREAERGDVVERLQAAIEASGLVTDEVGGLYQLQASLGELVASSLARGLGGLFLLFVPIAWAVSRSPAGTAATLLSLLTVPVILLGAFGLAGAPLDIISSPAANVAIAVGVDAMIHLGATARRLRQGPAGLSRRAAWSVARARLGPAVLGAAAIVGLGFGIFALSSFPPSQRFGLAVALGTFASAAAALVLLPELVARFSRS
ncbi:MAG: MMPL family transporter [Acidobacteriota bacterium]